VTLASLPELDREALQRRTIATLRLTQVPAQAAVAGVVAVLALLIADLLGSDRWAGVGNASFTLGSALMAPTFAAFMRRNGRRPGLVTAFVIGAVGAAVAAFGGQVHWWPVVVVGMVLFGGVQAGSLQGRYVAADLAAPGTASEAIAAVVWLGTLGAVFGPVLTPQWKALAPHIGLDELVAPIAAAALLALLAATVVWFRLRPDPLAVAGGIDPDAERVWPWRSVGAAAVEIRRSPGASLGIVAMATVQATMVAVMTMTPAHMRDHGQADLSAYVIAVHIAGMYGASPWVGRWVARVGAERAIMSGALVLAAGTAASVVAGYHPALIFIGLFLLGLGWSIGLIAGSSLVSERVAPEVRVEVQGTADLTMSVCGGLAAFSSGFVKQAFGFHLLANVASGAAIALAALTAWTLLSRRADAY
jgi:MFS family permease